MGRAIGGGFLIIVCTTIVTFFVSQAGVISPVRELQSGNDLKSPTSEFNKTAEKDDMEDTGDKVPKRSVNNLLYVLDPNKNIYSAYLGRLRSISADGRIATFNILRKIRELGGSNYQMRTTYKGDYLKLDLDDIHARMLAGAEGRILFFTAIRNQLLQAATFSEDFDNSVGEAGLMNSLPILATTRLHHLTPKFSLQGPVPIGQIGLDDTISDTEKLGIFLISGSSDKPAMINRNAFAIFQTSEDQ